MPRFQKRPEEIEAHCWNKNGDHPEDESTLTKHPTLDQYDVSEGKIVHYFREPDILGDHVCPGCHQMMHLHGWIVTTQVGASSGRIRVAVCPGDWIIRRKDGTFYPMHPDIFSEIYVRI